MLSTLCEQCSSPILDGETICTQCSARAKAVAAIAIQDTIDTPSSPPRKEVATDTAGHDSHSNFTFSRRTFIAGLAGLTAIGGTAAWAASSFLFSHSTIQAPWHQMEVIYWHENQVIVMLHSEHHRSVGIQQISQSLHLAELNQFLNEQGFNLKPFALNDLAISAHDSNDTASPSAADDINSALGKYLFSSPTGTGTFVVAAFHIERIPGSPSPSAKTAMVGNTIQAVNLLNQNLQMLHQKKAIPLIAAMPNWLSGATPFGCGTHGCPITPPIPVAESCAAWHITLPELAPTLQKQTGDGVTVFVLDTIPSVETIRKAAQSAGKSNLLLQDVFTRIQTGSIVIDHQTLPTLLAENAPDTLFTGKDIYGRLTGFIMSDHGLFVTGIVHDLAPGARIECIRVLNDYGVGNVAVLLKALQGIQRRMESGDLRNRPVVINLSLVTTPPQEELPKWWFGNNWQDIDVEQLKTAMQALRSPLHNVIQSLAALGAVIVGSAGNDSDPRDTEMHMNGVRMGARYPAAFPEVISVGAVDKDGNAAPYSNYPVPGSGVATYGGGLPKPVHHEGAMTTATNIDALRGIYSSPVYPALSVEDPQNGYSNTQHNAWSYWSGTSFATPIISATAARILEHLQASNIPSHQWAAEVQKALATTEGQKAILGNPLPNQTPFGPSIGVLAATQNC